MLEMLLDALGSLASGLADGQETPRSLRALLRGAIVLVLGGGAALCLWLALSLPGASLRVLLAALALLCSAALLCQLRRWYGSPR